MRRKRRNRIPVRGIRNEITVREKGRNGITVRKEDRKRITVRVGEGTALQLGKKVEGTGLQLGRKGRGTPVPVHFGRKGIADQHSQEKGKRRNIR